MCHWSQRLVHTTTFEEEFIGQVQLKETSKAFLYNINFSLLCNDLLDLSSPKCYSCTGSLTEQHKFDPYMTLDQRAPEQESPQVAIYHCL